MAGAYQWLHRGKEESADGYVKIRNGMVNMPFFVKTLLVSR
jgi:hypothetical protein